MVTFSADRWLVPFLSSEGNGRQNPAYRSICFLYKSGGELKANYSIENSSYAKKKSHLLRNIIRVVIVVLSLSAVTVATIFVIQKTQQNKITLRTIRNTWAEYDYQKVYEYGKAFLQDNPYNNTALTYYSYACFFLHSLRQIPSRHKVILMNV